MQNRLLVTAEILVVIVMPLIVLYSKGNWRLRDTIACLLLISVLWYLTYAPLHELSHIAGTYPAGGSVTDYKLIPRFWAGEFEIAGVTVLRCRVFGNAFVVGLVFMLLCLRPAFDLVCETVAFLNSFRGDLYNIQAIVGEAAIGSFVLASLVLSFLSILTILKRYDGFPEKEPISSHSS